MSLDGLRAWIGLLERKLTMRTRVFLVLVAIAVGLGGVALFVAIDAGDNAVSKSDLENARGELGGGGAAAEAGELSQLEAEVQALKSQVEALQSGSGAGGKNGGGSSSGGSGGSSSGGGSGAGGAASGGGSAPGTGAVPENQKQLRELVEKAQKEAEATK